MKITGFADTIRWYDKNAKKYADDSSKVIAHELINKFMQLLPKNPTVLDAGCGAGKDSNAFYEQGAQITGIDISRGLLKEARKRHPKVKFILGNFLNLPFDNEALDGIWAHAAIVHLEKEEQVEKALSEFKRTLKNGGILHIFVKTQLGKNKTEILKDTLSNHERFFRYYTENELEKLLKNNSFDILEITKHKDPHGRDAVQWIAFLAKKVL